MPRGRPKKNTEPQFQFDKQDINLKSEIPNPLMADETTMSLVAFNLNENKQNTYDYDVITEMSIEEVANHKKILAEKKKQFSLQLDNRKLDEAIKIMGGAESILDIMTDPEVLNRVKNNTKSAMDIKFLSDAYGKFIDKMQNLTRLDSIDSEGNSNRILLEVQTKDGNRLRASIGE